MTFPEPVISVAIEAKTKADLDKLGVALQKLAYEDPSFRTHTDDETGQTIISGMASSHLEIIVDRMRREFRVECNVVGPRFRTESRYAPGRERRPQVRKQFGRSRSTATSASTSSQWSAVVASSS